MRAGIGNRVSRKAGASIAEQDAENSQVCKENRWDVVDRYEEVGSASRYARRPRKEWPRLLADLEAGRLDVVVLWESSRGDRTLVSWIQFLDLCMDRRVFIHVTSDSRTYDMNNAHDYRELANDGVDARHESEKTHKRVSRTVRAQALAGKPHGKIPFGYRREYWYETEDGKQVRHFRQLVDEKVAPLIREMADRVLAGEALYTIARDLNERGEPTPTGRPWDLARVRQILLNPTVAGQRVYQGKVLEQPAAWPAILEAGVFAQLEAKLRDPARRTFVDGSVRHLLTNIMVCGRGGALDWAAALTPGQFELVCGATVRVVKNRGRHTYMCRDGFHVSVSMGLADSLVTATVLGRLAREDAAAVFARPDDGTAARAGKEAAGLQARLDGFTRAAVEGKLSPERLGIIEAELLPKIKDAEQRARPVARSPLIGRLIKAEDLRAAWNDLLITQQREVVRELVVPVVVQVGKGQVGPGSDHRRIKFYWQTESLRG